MANGAETSRSTKPSTAGKALTKVEVRYVPANKVGDVFLKAQLGDTSGFMPVKDMDLIDMPGLNATRRAPNHPKNLETIYKHYQNIDGTPDERCTQLKVRSMTVGDAIVIDNVPYYVATTGFLTKNEQGDLVPVEAPAEAK